MKKPILFALIVAISVYASGTLTKNRAPKPCECEPVKLFGISSYYADKFEGRKTANGETFRQDSLTAACNVLPLGTELKVKNLKTGDSVFLRVNDRLAKNNRRLLDLSREAARRLDFVEEGLAKVEVVILDSCLTTLNSGVEQR